MSKIEQARCAICGETSHEDGEGADENGEGGADGDVFLDQVGDRILCGGCAEAEKRAAQRLMAGLP